MRIAVIGSVWCCILATWSADQMEASWKGSGSEAETPEQGRFLQPLPQAVRDMYMI